MSSNIIGQFLNAYTITSQIMFPILVFIVILLIRDFNKYGNISAMINNRLNDLTDLVESTGFKKDNSDTNLDYLEKYLLNKENKTKKK
tara:strand:+ start:2649 stop:2912 length:264 start_codon:yes stop_codon:yes gene_type:complete